MEQSIHDYMAEKAELAAIYAQDGAFYTAADILAELSDAVREHARNCDPRFAADQAA